MIELSLSYHQVELYRDYIKKQNYFSLFLYEKVMNTYCSLLIHAGLSSSFFFVFLPTSLYNVNIPLYCANAKRQPLAVNNKDAYNCRLIFLNK